MNTEINTAAYWDERWEKANTPWDIGNASSPLITYLSQYENKDAKILIPGCGRAHEAEYLMQQGFQHVTLIDIASRACEILQEKFQHQNIQILCQDFFQLEGTFDLILEQTFFCALPPALRQHYANKMASLLTKGGCLFGVLFDRSFMHEGPPFGGSKAEYLNYFQDQFNIEIMEDCYNSITPRAGTELFFKLSKK